MKSLPPDPLLLLRSRYWARLVGVPAWIGVICLIGSLGLMRLVHKNLFSPLESSRPLIIWCVGLTVTCVLVGLAYALQRRRLAEVGRELDRQLKAKNRLETAAELAAFDSPLATAQRSETAAILEKIPPMRRSIFPELGIVFAGLLLLIFFGVVASWMFAVVLKPLPPENLPTASIAWESPHSEIKATKVEEVPLSAMADSTTGLGSLTLEIAVNGKHRKSVSLSKPSISAGNYPINTSLYLDELEVEPFDVISYNLRAERKFHRKLPPTLSELQFIQIRPFREDTIISEGGGGSCSALLTKLKIAQLQLMKRNFILAASELPKSKDPWKSENQTVATEEETLAAKTREAIEYLITKNVPPAIIDSLTKAASQMSAAMESIRAIHNEQATSEQGEALALITSCEKLFQKVISKKTSPPKTDSPPKLADPFRDEQKFVLPPREMTAAGKLEKAEQKQAEIVKDLNEGPGEPDNSDQQAEVGKQLEEVAEKITSEGSVPAEAEAALQKAQEASKQAEAQLKANDSAAAREPATRALQEMRTALASLKEQAIEAFADAQKQLNNAAGEMQKSAGKNGSNSSEEAEEPLHEMTGADKLEKAEQKQAEVLKDLNEGQGQPEHSDPQAEVGKQLEEAIDKITSEGSVPAEVEAALQKAQEASKQAEAQLKANDSTAAREPATCALQEMRTALASLKEQGGGAFADAQKQSNNAAGEMQKSEGKNGSNPSEADKGFGRTAARLREKLRREATRQQEVGSEKAATDLAALADKVGAKPKGTKETEGKRLQMLAMSAAAEQLALLPTAKATAETLAELRRAQANIHLSKTRGKNDSKALNAEIIEDLESAVQKTDLLVHSSKSEKLAKQILEATLSARSGPFDFVVISPDSKIIDEPLAELISLLEQGPEIKRAETISQLEVEEAPPIYRSAVARYFERLSREASRPTKSPEPQ